MIKYSCLIVVVVFHVLSSLSSSAGTKTDPFYYQNSIYKESIQSVQFFRIGNALSIPLIELGGDAKLILKFDELGEEAQDYSYTMVHCDANWNESYLLQSEYLEGFPNNPIEDYANSFNTTTKYVNYQLQIPNDDCRPKISGNYALVVFNKNNQTDLLLIQRFYVLDQMVRIEGLVKKATFDPFKGSNQEVDFKIHHERLKLLNPERDIQVTIMQNRRWDNAIYDLKPRYIVNNVLDYNYDKENVFPGGNEFRYFDIRSMRFKGENVQNIDFFRPLFHVTLVQDAIRNGKAYMTYKDMNGNYVIESQNRVNDYDTDCDYALVHFSLPLPGPLTGGSVNVFGALTGWNANKSNEMKWNFTTARYELELLLKEGYYNYVYAYVPSGAKKADTVNLEGSFVETENDYQIFAYFHDLTSRYDRLVGYVLLNSMVK